MSERVFTCGEVDIDHEQLVSLCGAGDLRLGIHDEVSAQILGTQGAGPSITTANAAGGRRPVLPPRARHGRAIHAPFMHVQPLLRTRQPRSQRQPSQW